MKRRLFWKILVGFWITFMVIINGIWLMFMLLRSDTDASEYMRSYARMSVAATTSAIRLGGEQAFERERKTWPRDLGRHIQVSPVAPTGQAPAAAPARRPQPLASETVSAPSGTRYRVAYFPQPRRSHGIPGIPRVTAIVAALGGLVFAAILAWYLTQPIQRMQAGFGRLARGDFATRLGPAMGRRRDEIADLAHAFDKMAMRLEELVAARDRLLADVSHELRTPLARLNLAIELARQDPTKLSNSLDRITKEAAQLDEMVGELLTLSKLESSQSRGEDYFNFAEVVRSVVQDARYEASAKGVEVCQDIKPEDENFEWIALGSGKLMSRAIENIVRNAVRYSPEGGKVTATLRHVDGNFNLVVTDEGPGVPQDAMATLFKPFGVSADGSGFGLGLAIAQRAIAVHGGSISVRNRPTKGLEMTVSLPAVAIEPA